MAMEAVRLLFCGVNEFPDSINFTRFFLRNHPHVQVDELSLEDVVDNIYKYDICVVRKMKFDESAISRATKMKLIAQFGVGLEGVDIPSATKVGIKVARIPSDDCGNALSCAEHAIYLMLALLRDQKGMDKSIASRQLGQPTGQTIYGKTVLIIGFGNIGKELVARLRAFGVHILAIKRSWKNKLAHVPAEGHDASLVDEAAGNEALYEFASRSDIIVTCCPLTPESAGMINDKFLAAMKKGAKLVNVARGGLLDYASVKAALESGQLGGLGMDVAWYEPFDPADPLLEHPKVVLTPHVAGVTELSYKNMDYC
ncbi:hypothetical protein O6H91_14G079600 [Diphasiastrum complanatum]|uniref:Uncharacterized protein n=1 Tax=Diphasiastrum complanatum TaxID=34168 RepID=A0ACC2BR72_DIPCM|nr:hypothetical protein O6H91_14G079600 [Diphasiastrum complanatum]